MYFENPKKTYYRFPSRNSVTDFDAMIPYYFPTKNSYAESDLSGSYLDMDYSYYKDNGDISKYDNTFL